jgi:hypothetical protein
MQTLSRDTSPDAERVQLELLRRMPPWRKLELVGAMTRTVYALLLAGLRERYPRATERELRLRRAALVLGRDLATRVYGPLPEEEEADGP